MRTVIDDLLIDEVAAFYNERAKADPTNAPSCRAIADRFGLSPSSAHKIRQNLWHAGRLPYPPRRHGAA